MVFFDLEQIARYKATAERHFRKVEEELFQKYYKRYECVRRYSCEVKDWILTIKDCDSSIDINLFKTSNWYIHEDLEDYHIVFDYDGKTKVLVFMIDIFDNSKLWFCGMNDFIKSKQ